VGLTNNGPKMIFGASAGDFAGASFTVNLDGSQFPWEGLEINSASADVTLIGTANKYLGASQTWLVAAGSTLTQAQTWNAGGLNYDNTALALNGGGTINFNTILGYNSGQAITQNGPTVNIQPIADKTTLVGTGGYVLNSGTLNFANALAFSSLNARGSGKLSLNGGTLDNTSGAAGTFSNNGGVNIGGSFTFAGSSDMSLGTGAVSLSGAPTVTVAAGTLTIGGAVSGSSGLTKAGPGTLVMTGQVSYGGATTVDEGLLVFENTSGSTYTYNGGNLFINNGSTLRFTRSGSSDRYDLSGKTFTFGSTGGNTLDTSSGLNFVAWSANTFRTTGGAQNFITGSSGMNINSGVIDVFDIARGSDASDLKVTARIWNAGGIVKTGDGILEMAGANTYSGSTTVNEGTLLYTGTYGSTSHVVANGAVIELNVPSGTRDYASTTFSGDGTLLKTGAGTARWGGTAATFAFASGALIDVQEGTFIGGSSANENWTANASDLNVAGGALFNGVEANVRVGALTGTGTIRSGYGGAGYSTFTFGVGDASGTFGGELSHNDGISYGHYTKVGTGTQTFTGTVRVIANGGGTGLTIGDGTVEIGGDGTFEGGSWPNAMINNGTFHYNSTVDNTMSGVISGTGDLVKGNTSTLTLNGNNTYTGQTTINGGVLVLNNPSGGAYTYRGGDININNGSTLRISKTGHDQYWFDGKSFVFDANGGGTIDTTSGMNVVVYGGSTVATGGGAQNSIIGSSGFNLHNSDTLTFDVAAGTGPVDLQVSAPLWNAGGIIKTGDGVLELAVANSYTGATTVNAGTLALSANQTIRIGNSLTINPGATVNLAAAGDAVRDLSSITIDGGTLADTSTSAGHNHAILLSGGRTLNLQNGATVTAAGAADGSGTYGQLFLGWGGVTVNVTGTPPSTLDARTHWANTTTVNVAPGSTLIVAGHLGNQEGSTWGYLNLTGGGTLIMTDGTGSQNTCTIGAGSTMQIGDGGTTGDFPNAAGTGSVTNNGTVVFNRSDAYAPNRVIGGSGSVVQAGAGTTTLNLANTYTGQTTINDGVLVLNNASGGAYTYTGGNININNGSTLRISKTGHDQYWFNGKSFLFDANGGGTIDTTSGVNVVVYGGSIVATGGGAQDSIIGASGFNLHAGNSLTFNVADGPDAVDLLMAARLWNSGGIIKNGAGVMEMAAANSYTGSTVVNEGTLLYTGTYSSPSHAVANGAAVELNVPSGTRDYGTTTFSGAGTLRKTGAGTARWGGTAGTFAFASGALIDVQEGGFVGGSSANENWTANLSDLNVAAGATFSGVEANVRVDALSGGGTISSGYGGAGYQRFTFGVDNGSGTFDGVLANGSAAGNYVKAGTGTQVLTGANTYTGSTTVEGGTLVYQNTYASTSHSIAANAVLELNVAGGTREMASTTFSGSGTLRKTGSGMARWPNTAATFALGAGSLIDVQGGTFVGGSYANENWTANLSSLNVEAGAVFNGVEANVRVDALTGGGTISSGYGGAGYQRFTFGVNNGSGTFDGVLTNGSAAGVYVKTGTGTQTLTGASTYTGGTAIEGGTLLAANATGSATGTGPVVVNGGTLGGTGFVAGNVTIATGGTVAAGLSPGHLSLGSNYLQSGVLAAELGGDEQGVSYDWIEVFGQATLQAGAIIDLAWYGGYIGHGPFDILTARGGITNEDLDGILLRADEAGYGEHQWVASIVELGDGAEAIRLELVPEPATMALLGLAVTGLGGYIRRRRAA